MVKKLVIGVDQSYTRTGISIGIDGRLVKVTSINFKGCSSRSKKRKELARVIHHLLTKATQKGYKCVILCERIRTFSPEGRGKKDKSMGLRPEYLKMTGALIATIVDTAADFDVEVYSVDTRSWKSKIVGSSKPDKDGNKKLPTVRYVESLGFDLVLGKKTRGKNKGEIIYDDDAADSACICLYGFLPKNKQSLKLEE